MLNPILKSAVLHCTKKMLHSLAFVGAIAVSGYVLYLGSEVLFSSIGTIAHYIALALSLGGNPVVAFTLCVLCLIICWWCICVREQLHFQNLESTYRTLKIIGSLTLLISFTSFAASLHLGILSNSEIERHWRALLCAVVATLYFWTLLVLAGLPSRYGTEAEAK
jgi:uncharacterized membrane protein YjgN (DUF898 family)